jgi:hypothetical protein
VCERHSVTLAHDNWRLWLEAIDKKYYSSRLVSSLSVATIQRFRGAKTASVGSVIKGLQDSALCFSKRTIASVSVAYMGVFTRTRKK